MGRETWAVEGGRADFGHADWAAGESGEDEALSEMAMACEAEVGWCIWFSHCVSIFGVLSLTCIATYHSTARNFYCKDQRERKQGCR